jgi:uncharacterized protein YdgA (DUF945 family)
MTKQTTSALQQLTSCSKTLNEVSDLLSQQLVGIENSINQFNLGVTAVVTLRTIDASDGNQPVTSVDELRYRKHQGKWALVWTFYIAEDPENTWQEKLLRESPREIRLLAAKELPALIAELVKKADELAGETADRAVEAGELAAALKTP